MLATRVWSLLMVPVLLSLSGVRSTVAAVRSDDFERHMLGPNWIVLAGAGSLALVGNSDLGLVIGPARGGAIEWGADPFLADQFSEAEISTDRVDSMLTQVFVRHRSADNARYGFHWNDAFGGRWEIKYDGVPTAQTRILASLVAPEPLPGDRIRIEARAAVISGYHNGNLILSAEDTAPEAISAGRLGMVFRFTTGFPAAYPSAVIESWSGGDLLATSVEVAEPVALPRVIVSPHPVIGRSTITRGGNIDWAADARFALYDARGRLACTLRNPSEFTLDSANHPAGVYFYVLTVADLRVATGCLIIE